MSEETVVVHVTKQEFEEFKAQVKKDIDDLKKEDIEIKDEIHGLSAKMDAFITRQTGLVGAIVIIADVAMKLFGVGHQ